MRGVLFFMIIGLLSASCEKSAAPDCFNNTGNIARTERTIEPFHNVLLKDNINLYLKKGIQHKLEVEAGANLLPKIKTDVNEDGLLVLQNENQCNWVRSYEKPINIYLTFVQLDSLEYRSIGDVNSEEVIDTESLNIQVREGSGKIKLELNAKYVYASLHYGTADIVLSGYSFISYVYSASFGLIDNRDLLCQNVYVTNKSSNDLYLKVSGSLGATIENIGNIYYYGNPESLYFNKLGTGELIQMTE